jgi:hypothetical protein
MASNARLTSYQALEFVSSELKPATVQTDTAPRPPCGLRLVAFRAVRHHQARRADSQIAADRHVAAERVIQEGEEQRHGDEHRDHPRITQSK